MQLSSMRNERMGCVAHGLFPVTVHITNFMRLVVPAYCDRDFREHFRMFWETFEVGNYYVQEIDLFILIDMNDWFCLFKRIHLLSLVVCQR